MENNISKENRLKVAILIENVLLGKLSVNKALSLFPKDKSDINIKCAFDALLHREADEDLRSKVKNYAQVQDDFLLDIATILKSNQQLPKNIIDEYLKYHSDNLIGEKYEFSFRNVFKYIKKMINF